MFDEQKINEAVPRCPGDRGDRDIAVSVWHPDGLAACQPGVYFGSEAGFVD